MHLAVLHAAQLADDVGSEILRGNPALGDRGQQRLGKLWTGDQRVERVPSLVAVERVVGRQDRGGRSVVVVTGERAHRGAAHFAVGQQGQECPGQAWVLHPEQRLERGTARRTGKGCARQRLAQGHQGAGAAEGEGERLRQRAHVGVGAGAEFRFDGVPPFRHRDAAQSFERGAQACEHGELLPWVID